MRPLLRPGTHPVRRADGSVQLGLDPGTAVVLPDRPGLRNALLDGSLDPDDPAVALLAAQELLVDERVLMPLVGGPGSPARGRPTSRPGRTRAAGAAVLRAAGDQAESRVRARDRARVEVVRYGHPAGEAMADLLTDLLAGCGIHPAPPQVADPTTTRGRRRHRAIGVLVGVGEPHRELADRWMRSRTPYVVARLSEGRAVLGPFVEPGRTACLRCIDAHHTDADPEWPLLVRQYAAATARDRADGAPEPVDPALAALAAAWTARDVGSFADGQRPSTWSSALVLGADLGTVESRSWLRHPECGCGWA